MPEQDDHHNPHDPLAVMQLLRTIHGSQLDEEALWSLARSIEPYLRRTRLPLEEAVHRISTHYLQDGARVEQLINVPATSEWQAVLSQVLAFAARHTLYPKDTDATSWPDLDAYEDIQQKLPSYNFEAPLDTWITVTVVNRLRRYWRDQQALSAGGPGFKNKAEREDPEATGQLRAAFRVYHYSLEAVTGDDRRIAESLVDHQPSVEELVEVAELLCAVGQEIDTLATHKNDPLLPQLWQLVVEQQLKLREAGERFDLSISQVYRRLEQVRVYLRHNPRVGQWFDPGT